MKRFEKFKLNSNELNSVHGGYESHHGGCVYSGGGVQNTNPNFVGPLPEEEQNNVIDLWYYRTMYEIGPIT